MPSGQTTRTSEPTLAPVRVIAQDQSSNPAHSGGATKEILFVPLHLPSMLEMLPIARRVAADGGYSPLFFFHNPIEDSQLDVLHQEGIRCVGPGINRHGEGLVSQSPRIASLKKAIWWVLPRALRQMAFSATEYGRIRRQARSLLKREPVAALVLVSDRHVGWETALVRVANRQGIPSLIVPYAASDPDSDVITRLNQADSYKWFGMESLSNRVAGALFPRWLYRYHGKPFLFLPAPQAVVAWALGIMPANPWAEAGGEASLVAVESPQLREMFIRQGVSEAKLVVTGKPSVDSMYQMLNQADRRLVRSELGILPGRHVLLLAVPQLAEQGTMPWAQHWQEIGYLLSTFARLHKVSVVLSLHPKSNPSDYAPLAQRYGAIIAKRRIYEILPASDVFVAANSSTVMQATGIGKPTVVVDFYGLDSSFYANLPGVITVRARDQLEGTLERLFSDPTYYETLVEAQRQRASQWVLLDGKCTDRVVEKLYSLIEPGGGQ